MKKILVTTDFSPAAENAVNLAAHVASKLNYSLSLFHCYHVPVPVGDMPFPPVSIQEIEDNVAVLFKKQAAKILSQFPSLRIETNFQAGMASEDIVKTANEKDDVALVVMGLTGAGQAGQWLFGSTSINVAKHCKKPVIIVPEDASWMPLKEIVFACDFKGIEDINGLDFFMSLVEQDHANIKILNVIEPGHLPSAEESLNGVKTDHVFSKLKHSYHIIENTNVEKGIEQFLADKKTQLIVMVRRNHHWFERLLSGGHTKKMPYHSHVPVLVLHEN
ncbi:MAG: universal stress protein [Flavobacteriales bacterium]